MTKRQWLCGALALMGALVLSGCGGGGSDGGNRAIGPERIAFGSVNTNIASFVTANGESLGSIKGPLTNSSASLSGDRRRIVLNASKFEFVEGRTVFYGAIYVGNADGTGLRQLTPLTPNAINGGLISFDGKKIVFRRSVFTDGPNGSFPSQTSDLFTMNSDGTNEKRLTRNGQSSGASFSRDGKRIVFTNPSGIAIMNADGSNVRQVTSENPNLDSGVSFSPDGKRLAFTRNGTVSLINVDGTGYTTVGDRSTTTGYGEPVVFSPDGRKLAYVRQNRIVTINLDGTGLTDVALGSYVVDWK